ncbi:MAG: FAD-binding oxidoreductase [Nitriliruptoraceae bacterium]|nr:FAD-binding oxidoreductase [Nitriliruptoraceae bacterium]
MSATADPDEPLLAALRAAVGARHVLTDPDLTAPHETDWTGRFTGRARAVVRPGDTDEVAAVLRACAAAGVPVVPQGGNTGLVGGGVPGDGEVVISCTRLDALDPVDLEAAQVTVGAGATLARVQAHARAAGLAFPVDLGARDSATIGGMVATNAGGVRVLRYGAMRAQVVGIEAVTAAGRVVRRLSGLVKDNAGYDLPGLIAGSEGTLAIVTRVRLRLAPAWAQRVVALVAVDGVAAAQRVLAAVRGEVAALEAAEFMFADGVELVCSVSGTTPPFPQPAPAYLLLECADRADPTDALAGALADLPEVRDVAVATDGPGRARLWALREGHTEAINSLGVPIKLDVSLPASALPGFAERVPQVVQAIDPGARTVLFGHLGDGNLHVNVVGADASGHAIDDAVLRLTVELGGSISAEHGIGRAKLPWMALHRDTDDVAAMRAIKAALDPTGLLNPDVLFPPEA